MLEKVSIFLIVFTGYTMPVFGMKNSLHTEERQTRQYVIDEIRVSPKIDGKLDENIWLNGEWEGSFTQSRPVNGASPSYPTKVKIFYDAANIYIGMVCHDPEPENIQVFFNKRDEWSGDVAGVAFDSYFDKRTAFEFNMTAAGQKIDARHKGNNRTDRNWNAIWDGATAINDSSWTIEMRIPLNQLRYINHVEGERTWGMHIWRYVGRLQEESQWQLIPRNPAEFVDNFGEVKGLENIRPGRQLEFTPYLSVGAKPSYANENPYINKTTLEPNIGFDAKAGISSNLTLNLTVNPDFGQVEADPSNLNLSTAEVRFAEKRPFFLEGTEIFDFDIDNGDFLYTRRIGSKSGVKPTDIEDEDYIEMPTNTTILSAAKLTGRTPTGWSVGVLGSVTDKENAIIHNEHGKHKQQASPKSNYLSSRVKKEINNANTIIGGALNYVERDLNTSLITEKRLKQAITGGVDFKQYWNNKNYFVTVRFAGSKITGSTDVITAIQNSHVHRFQRPDASHVNVDTNAKNMLGSHGSFSIGKRGGRWQYGFKGFYLSPKMNMNDLGFHRESDKIDQSTWVSYRIDAPTNLLRSFYVSTWFDNQWSFGKEKTNQEVGAYSSGKFHNFWSSSISFNRDFAELKTRALRGGQALYDDPSWSARANVSSNSTKKNKLNVNYRISKREKADKYSHEIGFGFTSRPVEKLKLQANASYSDNIDPFQYVTKNKEENKYLLGAVNRNTMKLSFRAEYYISPEISFQYYGSPYFSSGYYNQYKQVEQAGTQNFNERFTIYATEDIETVENNKLQIQEEGYSYKFNNPDFDYGQFRSNFVFKWEYKLGSVFYFVWSHEQTNNENSGASIKQSLGNLVSERSHDFFMMKFTYWFSI